MFHIDGGIWQFRTRKAWSVDNQWRLLCKENIWHNLQNGAIFIASKRNNVQWTKNGACRRSCANLVNKPHFLDPNDCQHKVATSMKQAQTFWDHPRNANASNGRWLRAQHGLDAWPFCELLETIMNSAAAPWINKDAARKRNLTVQHDFDEMKSCGTLDWVMNLVMISEIKVMHMEQTATCRWKLDLLLFSTWDTFFLMDNNENVMLTNQVL